MTDKNIIRILMIKKGFSQTQLALLAGYKGQANITYFLNQNKKGLRLNKFCEILDALDCDLFVHDISSGYDWKLRQDNGLKENIIIRMVMASRRISQSRLSELTGKSMATIHWYVQGGYESLRTDSAIEVFEAMGCVLQVVERDTSEAHTIDLFDEEA